MSAVNLSALPPAVRERVCAHRNGRPVYVRRYGSLYAMHVIPARYVVGTPEYGAVERGILAMGYRVVLGNGEPLQ